MKAPAPKYVSKEKYDAEFDVCHLTKAGDGKTKAERAFDIALEIRKFEIELYWKRATYFWAFIAVSLGAFGAAFAEKDLSDRDKGRALLTASSVGMVFSLAWYFVNRGSKFWQENWEKHVDLLEDGNHRGPLQDGYA